MVPALRTLYIAKVTRIIDGDTLKVDLELGFNITLVDQSVRVYGIQAPELNTRNKIEKAYARSARGYLQELLPIGKRIYLKIPQLRKDKYGRILAKVYHQAGSSLVDVAGQMISTNYATPYEPNNKAFNL